ncbi:MAG: hypothetical protein JSW20_03630 [Nitrospiraceae bacterium]|nr:MAG: hypothetical protein JSW20_03630 [Nitrospiraceae bacterium]
MRSMIVLFLVVIIGCASIGDSRRMDKLEMITDRYESALQWGQYETAFMMMRAEQNERSMTGPDDLRKFKITSYRLIHKSVAESGKEAKQMIEIKYYDRDDMIEKTLIDNQTWTYDRDTGGWFLSSGLPDFR